MIETDFAVDGSDGDRVSDDHRPIGVQLYSDRAPGVASTVELDAIAENDSIATRFQRGIFWSVAAAVIASGFNFLLNIVVARLLGRLVFGQFGMVQTTIATVAGIAQLAMGYTSTKFVAEYRSSDPVRAGRIIGLSSVVSLLTGSVAAVGLWVAAPWIAGASLRAPQLSFPLQLAGVMVFFTVLTGYQMGTMAGLERYRSLATIAVIFGGANLLASAVGAHVAGLTGAIAGMGFGSAVQFAAFHRSMRSACRDEGIVISIRDLRAERSILFSFALPAALGGLSSMPALWMATAFLARQASGFSEMALYTAAFTVRSFVFFLPSLLNRVTMSLLNNQRGNRNWEGYSRVFRTNILSTAAAVVLGAAAVSVTGVPILRIFGKDFTAGRTVLVVLLFAAIVETLTGSLYQVVQAESRMWSAIFAIMLPRDLLIVLLSYTLSPRMGALGLAAAYTIGWTVACVSTGIFVYRIGLGPHWREAASSSV